MPEPERIARLPHDPQRGLPIPWNVERGVDGVPLFTVNDAAKDMRCLVEGLCPICGERLGRWKWWVGGAMAAFAENGWYLDRPGHKECIEYALQVCPYLAAPNYIPDRITFPSEDKLLPNQRLLIDWSQNHHRPPLFVMVRNDRGEVSGGNILNPLLYTRPLRPAVEYRFWRHGQPLSEAAALPILRDALGADWEVPACRPE